MGADNLLHETLLHEISYLNQRLNSHFKSEPDGPREMRPNAPWKPDLQQFACTNYSLKSWA
jgi:hypothetical protein